MPDCIFCRIIKGEIKSDIIFRDDRAVAFPDVYPKAPVHILIVPIEHIPSVAELDEAKAAICAHMVTVANRLAREQGISESGYRLVTNRGPDAGQAVLHLHMHLIGGKEMGDIA
ncbi:MAG: histidine triad nucleotide-binding protein [Dehalococcoidia bacterium]|nr:histidine triad nucleotide-binding protein [Dehalococcoidia bacterium]